MGGSAQNVGQEIGNHFMPPGPVVVDVVAPDVHVDIDALLEEDVPQLEGAVNGKSSNYVHKEVL